MISEKIHHGLPDVSLWEASIIDIRKRLVFMSERTQDALRRAAVALFRNDIEAANEVIEKDRLIDSLEVANDTAVYQFIAINHPDLPDMRFLLAAQRIGTMLERIGDHAVNIAEASMAISSKEKALQVDELAIVADRSQSMVGDALESFFGSIVESAESVLSRDDEVDQLVRTVCTKVKTLVFAEEMAFEDGLEIIRAAKNFERVADLATNISEETIFCIQARSVKHGAYINRKETAGPSKEPPAT